MLFSNMIFPTEANPGTDGRLCTSGHRVLRGLPRSFGVSCASARHPAASWHPSGQEGHSQEQDGLLDHLRAIKTSRLTKCCGRVRGLTWTRLPAGLFKVIQAARSKKNSFAVIS